MHERDARPAQEGVSIPGKQVLPAIRHGVNRKLRRQLKALAGKENAAAKLEARTGFGSAICEALLSSVAPRKSTRGK